LQTYDLASSDNCSLRAKLKTVDLEHVENGRHLPIL